MFNKITYVTGKVHEAMSEVAGSGINVAGRRISVMGCR
jgi:rRNA processing protein Krr1/Pno1